MIRVVIGLVCSLIFLLTLMPACTSDQLPEPVFLAACDTTQASYSVNIKEIVDRSCAYSGCHVEASIGNFLTYEDMLPRLKNGSMRQRVINLRDDPIVGMPPNYAPAERPQRLSEAELVLFECWLEAGFPE